MAEQNKPDDGFNWAYVIILIVIMYIIEELTGCNDYKAIERMIDTGNYYH